MNIAIVGSKGLAKSLGKQGTKSDLLLYNTSFQGKYFTFIEPDTYPEKISPLFQALNMSQYVVLYLTKDLEKQFLGECIIAIDMLDKRGAIFLDGVDEQQIKHFLGETRLKDFNIFNNEVDLMQEISSINFSCKEKPKVIVDHSFIVKSVGLVALGTVVSGEIKKYDKLKIYPSKKEVLIKSIQIHDKDYEKAYCFDRVGLALKGIEESDIERGSIISEDASVIKRRDGIKITKNKFYKEQDPVNVMCVVGLQYVNAKLNEGNIEFSREIAYDNDKIIILTPDKKMRVFGIAFSDN